MYCATCGGRGFSDRLVAEGWYQCVQCAVLFCPLCCVRLQQGPESPSGFRCAICSGQAELLKNGDRATPQAVDLA